MLTPRISRARVLYGALSPAMLLYLLLLALGRDSMSLIGPSIVMVMQDPIMALDRRIDAAACDLRHPQAGQAGEVHCKHAMLQGRKHPAGVQGDDPGAARCQGVQSRGRCCVSVSEDIASLEKAANQIAQVGVRSGPLWKSSAAAASRWSCSMAAIR